MSDEKLNGGHTPGLWRWVPEDEVEEECPKLIGPDGQVIIDLGIYTQYYPVSGYIEGGSESPYARQITAALNATEGIPTEALEGGVVGELLDALEELADAVDPTHEPEDLEEFFRNPLAKARAAIARATGATP